MAAFSKLCANELQVIVQFLPYDDMVRHWAE